MHPESLFETETVKDIVVVTPTRDMGEFEMASNEIPAYDQLVELTDGRSVVVDLAKTDYFGSSTIGMFIRLVKHVHSQGRAIAFCNLSKHEQEVVDITHVHELLDLKDSQESAIEFVENAIAKTKSDSA